MPKIRAEDFTMFKKSQPWGYHPVQVEGRIAKYEETIKALTEKYLSEREVILKMANKIEQLQNELRDMHLQMSSLELPEASEAVEHCVLDDFRNYNNVNNDDSIPGPEIVSGKGNVKRKSNEEIQNTNISYSDSDDFDNNFITGSPNRNTNNDDDDFVIIT